RRPGRRRGLKQGGPRLDRRPPGGPHDQRPPGARGRGGDERLRALLLPRPGGGFDSASASCPPPGPAVAGEALDVGRLGLRAHPRRLPRLSGRVLVEPGLVGEPWVALVGFLLSTTPSPWPSLAGEAFDLGTWDGEVAAESLRAR